MRIPIDRIRLPKQRKPDQKVVDGLLKCNPDTWPPIVVEPFRGCYRLKDGFNRIMAAKTLKFLDIEATIHE